ncbi:hypothetical protein HN51_014542 [Arachis hypogaea]|uniref:Uncharacterized protein n=1 Tax=Arachis hypogaea TaxID=3818 RepID=A0A445CP15_ARAHY|nr:uncharacterized protein LOC112695396 [Arachis hypogaea]RYR52666.1 hypothetical protein Ahy_A06g027556 [Arachis hypogaea]
MMRCFLPTCFGSCKRSKRSNPTATQSLHSKIELQYELLNQSAEAAHAATPTKDEEERLGRRGEKKDERQGEGEGEQEFSESLFSLSIGSAKQISAAQNADTTEVNSPMQQQQQLLLGVRDEDSEALGSSTPTVREKVQGNSSKPAGFFSSDKEADIEKPAEQQNCIAREEGGDVNGIQEESSESLFSLSTDYRKPISSAEIAETEVNSLRQDKKEETQERVYDVSSVLNPIENVDTQGRVAKSTLLKSLKNNDKENINNSAVEDIAISLSPEPNMKLSKCKARQKANDNKLEIGVDTSLSSWLVEPEGTPVSVNKSSVGEQTPKGGRGSSWSNEDRPILGALTVEEIRMHSLSRSSRRTRSKSPDETPIIGTVGSYWTHTGQDMESSLNNSGRKDAKLKSSSSTCKTRLERAFEESVCEV